MANSDLEDFEISTTPPSISEFAENRWSEQGAVWCKTFCERRLRRYTVSHAAPPAPPSTPTLLTSPPVGGADSNSPTPTSTAILNGTIAPADNNRFNHYYYVTSSKNTRRDPHATDTELAELFKAVTITNRLASNSGSNNNRGSYGCSNSNNSIRHRSSKYIADRGIRNASRTISKLNGSTKIFKIHRNPKEFLREPDEDSVSAPEYDDTEEEDARYRHFWRYKTRRMLQTRRERKFARFEHQERMETIIDNFDASMKLQ